MLSCSLKVFEATWVNHAEQALAEGHIDSTAMSQLLTPDWGLLTSCK